MGNCFRSSLSIAPNISSKTEGVEGVRGGLVAIGATTTGAGVLSITTFEFLLGGGESDVISGIAAGMAGNGRIGMLIPFKPPIEDKCPP
jgi:hypothetical protein